MRETGRWTPWGQDSCSYQALGNEGREWLQIRGTCVLEEADVIDLPPQAGQDRQVGDSTFSPNGSPQLRAGSWREFRQRDKQELSRLHKSIHWARRQAFRHESARETISDGTVQSMVSSLRTARGMERVAARGAEGVTDDRDTWLWDNIRTIDRTLTVLTQSLTNLPTGGSSPVFLLSVLWSGCHGHTIRDQDMRRTGFGLGAASASPCEMSPSSWESARPPLSGICRHSASTFVNFSGLRTIGHDVAGGEHFCV